MYSLVGPLAVFGGPGRQARFPIEVVLIAADLANGWPCPLALQSFAGVSLGSSCSRGFGFSTFYGLKLSPEHLRVDRLLVYHVRNQRVDSAPE